MAWARLLCIDISGVRFELRGRGQHREQGRRRINVQRHPLAGLLVGERDDCRAAAATPAPAAGHAAWWCKQIIELFKNWSIKSLGGKAAL